MSTSDREKLLDELCEKYPYVMRLMKIMGVEENDIEDLAAEIFIDAFKGIGKLRDPEKLVPWLKVIATNKSSRYFRKRSNRREISNMIKTEAGEMDVFDTLVDEVTVEQILQEAENKQFVERLVDTLPEAGKRIIRMRFWGEYKHEEIARIMNINLNTEKSIYRRSLKRLEKNYFEIFGEEDVHERNR